jgi:integrase
VDIADGYTGNHLLPIWGGHRLCDLRARTLDAWIVDLHRDGKLAPATINKLLQTLRTILDQAVLAATTGMRMGEVRALLLENVQTDQVEIRRGHRVRASSSTRRTNPKTCTPTSGTEFTIPGTLLSSFPAIQ